MGIINGINQKEKRRLLRKKQTPEEAFVWNMIRGNKTDLKWKRQVSIGVYVADFYCASKKMVIELDGNQHLSPKAKEYGFLRDKFFKMNKIKVIRISNSELNNDPSIVYKRIGNTGA